jgi:hypothetical protein
MKTVRALGVPRAGHANGDPLSTHRGHFKVPKIKATRRMEESPATDAQQNWAAVFSAFDTRSLRSV